MRKQVQLFAILLPIACFALPGPASAQWLYPPPAWRYAPPESNLRITVKPKDASVYVDGFFAGKVDDFDGAFQRLHVTPGPHELVIYLEGYRSMRRRMYLVPNATRTITGELDKLAPGDPQEPQPEPTERVAPPDETSGMPPQGPPRGPRPPVPARPGPSDQPMPRRGPATEPGEPSRYASLSIRIQPDAATVRIDGERWDGPSGDERLIVQVSAGHHVIEVERDGFDRFTTEVDVRAGETHPVNVSLRRR